MRSLKSELLWSTRRRCGPREREIQKAVFIPATTATGYDYSLVAARSKENRLSVPRTKPGSDAKKILLTAFSSPRLPHFAKWALRLALELPAATPHKARRMLEKLNRITLGIFDSAGDRQSSTIAVSLKMSAAKRYILHSGSRAVPSLWANRIVAILPVLS